jgi:hypothetical protein
LNGKVNGQLFVPSFVRGNSCGFVKQTSALGPPGVKDPFPLNVQQFLAESISSLVARLAHSSGLSTGSERQQEEPMSAAPRAQSAGARAFVDTAVTTVYIARQQAPSAKEWLKPNFVSLRFLSSIYVCKVVQAEKVRALSRDIVSLRDARKKRCVDLFN